MYKIIKITTCILLIANIAKAQTEKGNQTLGLSVGYNTQKANQTNLDYSGNVAIQGSQKLNIFSLAPAYSYFIANKFDLGFAAGFGNMDLKNTYVPVQQYASTDQHDRTYNATIFLRKYFLYADKIGLRAGPFFNYYHDLSSITFLDVNAQSDNKTTTSSFDTGLQMDFVYYPYKRIGLAATLANLSYGHYKQAGQPQTGSGDTVNLVLIGSGLSLSVFYTFY